MEELFTKMSLELLDVSFPLLRVPRSLGQISISSGFCSDRKPALAQAGKHLWQRPCLGVSPAGSPTAQAPHSRVPPQRA